MQARTTWLVLSLSAVLAAPAMAQITPGTAPGTFTGPSSSQTPYVIPSVSGWNTLSLISVADAAKDDGYAMVGIPDGLGALRGRFRAGRYVDKDDYMTVFMNHELTGPSGIARAHGQTGAFVSQWTIRLRTLQVSHGEDLIQNLYTW